MSVVSQFFNRFRYGKGTPSLKAVIVPRRYFSRSENKYVEIRDMHDHHLANAILKLRREISGHPVTTTSRLQQLANMEFEAAIRGFDVY